MYSAEKTKKQNDTIKKDNNYTFINNKEESLKMIKMINKKHSKLMRMLAK